MFKRLSIFIFILICSSCYAQLNDYPNISGTRKDTFLIGKNKNIAMVLERAYKDSIADGDLIQWESSTKAFRPTSWFKLDSSGFSIMFDSIAVHRFRIDSTYTKTNQNASDISFQAGQLELIGNQVSGLEQSVVINDSLINLESLYRYNTDTLLNANIKIQADRITQEVTDRLNYDDTLSTKIEQTAADIWIKASVNDEEKASILVSSINGGTVQIAAKNVSISGETSFASGYDPSGKTDPDQVTTIIGNTVNTGYINALGVTAASVSADWVYAGTISADKISGGTINGININGTTITGAAFTTGEYMGGTEGQIDVSGSGMSGAIASGSNMYGFSLSADAGLGFAKYGPGESHLSINADGISLNGASVSFEGHTHTLNVTTATETLYDGNGNPHTITYVTGVTIN